MIKDFFISFKENFSEKTKNPFLGTYLFVWLIRNWDLIFTLFNFDDDHKLKDRILFIQNYYSKLDFIENLAINILWSFGLLITTYLLLNVSRFIVNLFDKRLTPWIHKITDPKSIVLKSVYLEMRSERDELQNRLDNERESKSRLERRIKNLETEIIEFSSTKSEREQSASDRESNSNNSSRLLLDKIKAKGLLQEYIDTTTKINKGEAIDNSYEPKDYFVGLGLLKYQARVSGLSRQYALTQDGESVIRLARLE